MDISWDRDLNDYMDDEYYYELDRPLPEDELGDERDPENPLERINNPTEALEMSLSNRNLPRMQKCLDAGADATANDSLAFRDAVHMGFYDAVTLLLGYGADVHANDNEAWKTAIKKGDKKMMQLLYAYGADDYTPPKRRGRRKKSSFQTKMAEGSLPSQLTTKIEERVYKELTAALTYFQLASIAYNYGDQDLAATFMEEASNEIVHANNFAQLLERPIDVMAQLSNIKAAGDMPNFNNKNSIDLLTYALKIEKEASDDIEEIIEIARSKKVDDSVLGSLTEYLARQFEDIQKYTELLGEYYESSSTDEIPEELEEPPPVPEALEDMPEPSHEDHSQEEPKHSGFETTEVIEFPEEESN